ncbi:hypothetical protein CsatB_000072 [Cannabis sativa]
MIPHSNRPSEPMFGSCLNWVLNNQTEHGFWGNCNSGSEKPTLSCLTATLACIVALKKWNICSDVISKGLEFMDSSNAKKLLKEVEDHGCPRWFAIVFPGMVELAEEVLKIKILKDDQVAVRNILFKARKNIFETVLMKKGNEDLLLWHLEVLPSSSSHDFGINNIIKKDDIVKHLCEKGSLFNSPSATAKAFMATSNSKCLHYLQALVHTISNNNHMTIGVPTTYPMDEDLIKLCIINHLQRLGLAEHFSIEIENILQQIYKNYDGKSYLKVGNFHSWEMLQLQLLKDSLAFRLLRMHGYKVFSRQLCWFLHNEEIKNHIETNCEYFAIMLLNLYKATDLAFQDEFELNEARNFSRKLLEKCISMEENGDHIFHNLIEHELSLPWMARLDHLEHRFWIEETKNHVLWLGKNHFRRLLSIHNDKLIRLAILNYHFKQSIFKAELEHLTRWCKDWGLSEMGFGREKSMYCYFAIASTCSSLPYDSPIRLAVAKGAIIITVTDDFFDMKDSLITELENFTKAIQRWDGEGLSGVSKKIFDALDNFVKEMAIMYLDQQETSDITNFLREIWYETIVSWLTESKWSKSGIIPTMDEYFKVGMTSIATHTLLLPASYFLKPSLKISQLQSTEYAIVTKLVMIICRLLNDLQSYEKEKNEGKPNSITVYLKNNPEVEIEEAIEYVQEILNKKKKELLEHVLIDNDDDDDDDDNNTTNIHLPKDVRVLHLSCLKVFQMFFNSSNRFDSEVELLDDIGKAIYIPLKLDGLASNKKSLIMRRLPKAPPHDFPHLKSTSANCSLNMCHFSHRAHPSKHFIVNELSFYAHNKVGNWKGIHIMPQKLSLSFI